MTEMEPPTYYADIVTVSVDPDVAYIEIRRCIRTRAEMHRAGKSGAPDAITDDTVYAEARSRDSSSRSRRPRPS